jgi:hypothetical protein
MVLPCRLDAGLSLRHSPCATSQWQRQKARREPAKIPHRRDFWRRGWDFRLWRRAATRARFGPYLRPLAPQLLDTVRAAFVHGMDVLLWACGGIGLAGMLLALIFLPRRIAQAEKEPAATAAEAAGVVITAQSQQVRS